MPLFTSRRERGLWLGTALVLVAIYSTMGPARTLVDALRERNLLGVSFAFLVLVVATVVVSQWAKRRPGWREIGVALGIALAYWMTFLRMENPAERTHLIEYGIVAALIHQALLERARNGSPVPAPAAITVGATALLGLLDEGIQAVLPSRTFDWIDVIFNALAAFMAIVARLALAPVRLPGSRLWFLWLMAGAIGWGWSMDPSAFGEGRRLQVLPSLPEVDVPAFLGVAAGGIVVGVLQWLVLRRYVPRSMRWALASLGAVALLALLLSVVDQLDTDVAWVLGVGSYGTLVGVLQWSILRRHVARAGWWVLASTVGWVVALPLGDWGGPPGWAAYGAITATALVWLLRHNGLALAQAADRD